LTLTGNRSCRLTQRTDYLRGALVAPQRLARTSRIQRNVVLSTVAEQRVGTFPADEDWREMVLDGNVYSSLVSTDWADEHLARARSLGLEQNSRLAVLAFAGSDGQVIDTTAAEQEWRALGLPWKRSALAWIDESHQLVISAPKAHPFWPMVALKREDSGINRHE
jgi:hypothetical protein